jgi:hypothetical protein
MAFSFLHSSSDDIPYPADIYESERFCASTVSPGNLTLLTAVPCFDERTLSYDDGAQGQNCQLPFLMNQRYYETCTRQNPELQKVPNYWCASKNYTNSSTFLWTGGDLSNPDDPSWGLCPNYLFPPDNGCQDHYDAVREQRSIGN